MPIDIAAHKTAVAAIDDRIQAYKLVQRLSAGEDVLPARGALDLTVAGTDGGGPFTRTLQAQIGTKLVAKATAIVADATTESTALRTDILPLLGLVAVDNPDALQPRAPLADLFAEDADNVSAWLNGLLDFVIRVNAVLG